MYTTLRDAFNTSVQSATLRAGGLELSVAVLSLEGDQRKRYVPPMLAERSSRLLARLSAYPPAVEAMVKSEVVDRIMKVNGRRDCIARTPDHITTNVLCY